MNRQSAPTVGRKAHHPEFWTLGRILKATGGVLVPLRRVSVASLRSSVAGISIDTRTIRKGELYIAIVGKTLDGHQFVEEAFRKGACGAIVSRSLESPKGKWLIRVADTTRALGDIAAYHRRRFDPIVIAVTGSNGKSSTKEILASILARRFRVLKPKNSFNNDIGVPLTVLALDKQIEAVVIEMEMNILGGIRRLCEIAQPQIGIVTNIADTHLEFLVDRAGVAREKSELIEYLARTPTPDTERPMPDTQHPAPTAVLNADDPLVMEMGRRYPTPATVTFGFLTKKGKVTDSSTIPSPSSFSSTPDVFASRIKDLGVKGIRFYLNDRVRVRLPLIGVHNVGNALAAVAAAGAVGIRLHEAVPGLENVRPLPMRLQVERYQGLTLIVDCYNANPQSVAAALRVLEGAGSGRKIAVLGDMLELGTLASQAHQTIGMQAGRIAWFVLARGRFAGSVIRGALRSGLPRNQAMAFSDPAPRSAAPRRRVSTSASSRLVQKLIDIAQPGDTILVKGSRGNRLEETVQELKERIAAKTGRRCT